MKANVLIIGDSLMQDANGWVKINLKSNAEAYFIRHLPWEHWIQRRSKMTYRVWDNLGSYKL